ncbi:Transposon Ty3-G Gag-Pol polyprotein [Smittium mucronatum]|uniref:Transposon Ty3-G Gag-Pol polyprotein n=1 Tax=Smittium mucronatum TaxID=133383 RepID=A0A1R0GX47_9FUNG|nr:Transposon Ty3-G Gag-Pol polyprotein [Smittium mucronatum]
MSGISFEGLPTKFAGENTSVWIRRFSKISNLKGWEETTRLDVFKEWLDGDAYLWLMSTEETTPESEEWTFEEWTKKLQDNFPEKIPVTKKRIEFTLKDLEKLKPEDFSDFSYFNQEFRRIEKLVAGNMKTEEQVQRIYKEIVTKSDPRMAFEVFSRSEKAIPKLGRMMDIFLKLYSIRSEIDKTLEDTKDKSIKVNFERREVKPYSLGKNSLDGGRNQGNDEDVIRDLTRQLSELTLLVKNGGRAKKDRSSVICYNCNKTGHYANECRPKYEGGSSVENHNSVQSGMFVEVSSNKQEILGAQKRMRVEELMNPESSEIVFIPPKNTTKSKDSKKTLRKKKLVKKKVVEDAKKGDEFLDMIIQVPIRDYLKGRKSEIRSIASKISGMKNKVNLGEVVTQHNQNETGAYVPVKIGGVDSMIVIDSGASCSLVGGKLLKKLGAVPQKVANETSIVPVGGKELSILSKVSLCVQFTRDTSRIIEFLVLEDCAVPLILGRDAIVGMRGIIDYSKDVYKFKDGDKTIELQMYPKKEIIKGKFQVWNSDDESSSNEESEASEYSSDSEIELELEKEILLSELTGSQETEVTGYGEKGEFEAPKQIKELVSSYSDVFVDNILKLKGMHGVEYSINVPLEQQPIRFDWTEECQASFDLMKQLLSNAPVLVMPKDEFQFILSTDASTVAVGAVLEQQEQPIAYYSRKLSSAERNYQNYEREALAVVSALKHFRSYLLGRKFTVYTDNSAVASLYRAKDMTGRIVRWKQMLAEFDCLILHRKGKDNAAADYLSRPQECYYYGDGDSKDMKLKKVKEFLEGSDEGNKNKAWRQYIKNFIIRDSKLYRINGGKLLRVVMRYKEAATFYKALHDNGGHFEAKAVYNWLREKVWRPFLYKEISEYVKSCIECQKFDLRKPKYKFSGRSGISSIFEKWSADILGPFPMSEEGNTYISCFIEHLTRFPIVESIRNATGSVVKDRFENIVSIFGPPQEITVDQGSCYMSRIFQEYCKSQKIRVNILPAYQPEWNGQVERLNRTIRYSLNKSVGKDWKNWDKYLPRILWGLRTKKNNTTNMAPYSLMFGNTGSHPINETEEVERNTERIIEILGVSGDRVSLERDKISSLTKEVYRIGDLVMVLNHQLRKGNFSPKQNPRYEGPFRVIRCCKSNTYGVQNEDGKVIKVHLSRLKPFRIRQI